VILAGRIVLCNIPRVVRAHFRCIDTTNIQTIDIAGETLGASGESGCGRRHGSAFAGRPRGVDARGWRIAIADLAGGIGYDSRSCGW
jgi:hypothetical protein